MADVKISALPTATTPLAGTEVLPIVQGGVTEQVSVANLTAGRTVAAAAVNVDADSATTAVRITQTGAGNALVVEDSANPDATPFVIDAAGRVGIGGTSSEVDLGLFNATTATANGVKINVYLQKDIQSDVTSGYFGFRSSPATAAASFNVPYIIHYYAQQRTFGAGSSVTTQFGFLAESSLVGATTNYGFVAKIPSAANRWNFYAEGTANNAFAGNSRFGATTVPVNTVDITGSFGRGAPVTKNADFTLAATENWVICNGAGSITVTLPAASSWTGREVMIKTIAAQTVVSASSNVVPIDGAAAGTAILASTAGKWATLVSNGTNWVIMAAN